MLGWVQATLSAAGIGPLCVVLSDERDGFAEFLAAHPDMRIAVQKNRQGTGDAVAAAAWSFDGVRPAPFAAGEAWRGEPIRSSHVLICAGDAPAVTAAGIRAFVSEMLSAGARLGVLGMQVPQPFGYGRLVTAGDNLVRIVEEKDADAATRALNFCSTGVVFGETELIFSLLETLEPNNSQREYYLTDIFTAARARGVIPRVAAAAAWEDFAGVNDRLQLAQLEDYLVQRQLRALMAVGVTCHQPATIFCSADVTAEPDVEVGPGCRLLGRTHLASGCRLGAGVVIENGVIGARAVVGHGSVILHSHVAADEVVPPLSARLR